MAVDYTLGVVRRLLLLFVFTILLLTPLSVARAESTAHVVITAQGFICAAPGGLTLTYIDDFTIGISWVKGAGSTNTIVRAGYGHLPVSRTDGYQVYYGPDETVTDTSAALTGVDVIYYRAWAQTPAGLWEEIGSTANTEGIMSASFLFLGLILLAVLLTFIAVKVNLMLFRIAASISWLALSAWTLTSGSTNLSISSTWTQLLGFVFVLMVIAPLTLQMVTEVHREASGHAWTEWGKKPSEDMSSSAQQRRYRQSIHERVGKASLGRPRRRRMPR